MGRNLADLDQKVKNIKIPEPVAANEVVVEVTKEMFMGLQNTVNVYHDQNDLDMKNCQDRLTNHNDRIKSLEDQIELVKKMGAPSSSGEDGPNILEVIDEFADKLRKEFDEKLASLLARVESLEVNTKATDDNLQKQIDDLNLLFSNHQNQIEALEIDNKNLKLNKVDKDDFDQEIHNL